MCDIAVPEGGSANEEQPGRTLFVTIISSLEAWYDACRLQTQCSFDFDGRDNKNGIRLKVEHNPRWTTQRDEEPD
ncbi:hypothetical protein Pst134EA_007588 [Puccinia striiformis f. sp. tritici]|uniref:hypothetical protein n=1 Tax=Puccinia striiformis f. sp. tritici TaxID=168172 RepID=UPI002007234D|nr:hypothetical protein Pst134EA_007588 [Puccinia striiformis f. sp. tritici]KAH9470322.1 hypothetical protein Pst134EA_007588 [Puccinia striiformis f. sp. tritici]